MLAGDATEAGWEYILNYMAYMVQKPGELPRVKMPDAEQAGCGENPAV